jgi:hypothetical protein
VSGSVIAVVVVFGLGAFTIVYSIIRVVWRLWRTGDVEPAHRDSDAIRRNRRDRPSDFD